MSVGGQKLQNSNYKINKFWDVMYRAVTMVNNSVICI